jgi:hypothetical protein
MTTFRYDFTKGGYELGEDVGEAELFLPSQLELVSFLKRGFLIKRGEDYISGEELVKRAKELKANLGQQQAEYLLEHQEEIPEEWQRYCLVFTGTVWRDRHGDRSVPCLGWDGRRWCLSLHWLEFGWYSECLFCRLLRPRE